MSALILQRTSNLLRTGLLLSGILALLGCLGWVLGGPLGLIFSLFVAGLFAAFAPSARPDRLMRAFGGRPLHPLEAPGLHEAVAALSARAGLARAPDLYLVPAPVTQAFATEGEGREALGLTPSLVRALSPAELVAVLAHEMSHLRGGDLWLTRLSESAKALTRSMATFGLLLLFFGWPLLWLAGVEVPLITLALLAFAPPLAHLLALALSRVRELEADRGAVDLGADPRDLASALARLEAIEKRSPFAALFPFEVPGLLRSHPPTADRIARLEALASKGRPPERPPAPGAPRVVVPIWRRDGRVVRPGRGGPDLRASY